MYSTVSSVVGNRNNLYRKAMGQTGVVSISIYPEKNTTGVVRRGKWQDVGESGVGFSGVGWSPAGNNGRVFRFADSN